VAATQAPSQLGFAEQLAARAQASPDATAFIYLLDGEGKEETITYARLHARASAIASQLAEHLSPGARTMILCPPGLDYVAALFGCFYAAVIGVSASPPHPKRLHRTLPRLLAIAADADVEAVLTTAAIRDGAQGLLGGDHALSRSHWLTCEEEDGGEAPADWMPQPADPSDVAFLQYTSGSTGNPRGVMLTHGNLLSNSNFIARTFGHSPASRGFIWLPPYHDMGLIGGILQPVHVGFPCVLTSPITIIKQPARWLEGISRYGATTSGGPNFAYELCVQRISSAQREKLDLSRWEVAFNGAEPIRPSTIERFSRVFEPAGFRASAFFPCYGLAEATLMVTAPAKSEPPVLHPLDAASLLHHRAETAGEGGVTTLVGCGRADSDHRVEIVYPSTSRRCKPGQVGEIWVSGPSVAAGYWRCEAETAETFAARIDGDPGQHEFLRTGDLGVLDDGELLVVGRLKDVLIIRGQNHHPPDIEDLAESAHVLLRAHCSAAFALDETSDERLAIVLEVEPGCECEHAEAMNAVRRRVTGELDLQVHLVALCAPGSVPKTTSGKIQRQLCRSLLAAGELEVLAEWHPHDQAAR
jgi:acyl-CoA synthetase (AMP-forming)/AMP-acid ligase II